MLSKEDSQALKGLAIILMLFHHLFLNKERFINFYGSYFPINESVLINISIACKICVCIFAFISGYGLYKSLHSYTTVQSGAWIKQHLIKSLSSYWFIALFFYLAVFVLNPFFDFHRFTLPSTYKFMNCVYIFLDVLGISNLINTFTLCGTWWYIGTAIFFIIISPFLYSFIERFSLTTVIVITLVPYLLKIGYPGGENTLTYFPVFASGMYFAQNQLFTKISNWKFINNQIMNNLIKLLILLFEIAFSILLTMQSNMKTDNLWPVFYCIFPVFVILLCKLYLFKINIIAKSLNFFGIHATNIWLCHTFIRENLIRFYPKMPHFIVIFLLLLALSIIMSYIIMFLKKLLFYNRFIDFCKEH